MAPPRLIPADFPAAMDMTPLRDDPPSRSIRPRRGARPPPRAPPRAPPNGQPETRDSTSRLAGTKPTHRNTWGSGQEGMIGASNRRPRSRPFRAHSLSLWMLFLVPPCDSTENGT
jgi:hypothetical protein